GLVRLRVAVRGGRPPRAVGGAREATSSAPPGGGGRHGPHVGGDGGVLRSPARRLRPAPADRPPAALLLRLRAGRGGPADTRAGRRGCRSRSRVGRPARGGARLPALHGDGDGGDAAHDVSAHRRTGAPNDGTTAPGYGPHALCPRPA